MTDSHCYISRNWPQYGSKVPLPFPTTIISIEDLMSWNIRFHFLGDRQNPHSRTVLDSRSKVKPCVRSSQTISLLIRFIYSTWNIKIHFKLEKTLVNIWTSDDFPAHQDGEMKQMISQMSNARMLNKCEIPLCPHGKDVALRGTEEEDGRVPKSSANKTSHAHQTIRTIKPPRTRYIPCK